MSEEAAEYKVKGDEKETKEGEDKEIIAEAKKRFAHCEDMESENNALWLEDLKFANGNSDNGYQWDDKDARSRDLDGRPTITINKVKQHNLQITNEAKKGRSSPKVVPVDDGSDDEVAEIFNGIIKHIEAQSNAESAYSTALEYAVDAGLGYWIITTDYIDDKTLDQEIYIERVTNPMAIRTDPDIKKADGSDMRYAFVYEDMPREDYKAKYGDDIEEWGGNQKASDWDNEGGVRLCEYYRITEKYTDLKLGGHTRKVCKKTVEWYLLTDKKVLDRKVWPGKYIPIVRVVGLETTIDGKVVRTSHTRSMKDAQRIYNMWSSSAVEFVKLQGKQPYLSAQEAIEGHEAYWDNLNKANYPYLPYNGIDENGNQIAKPSRQEPPIMPQAYIQGMQVSANDMQSVSGQYDGTLGRNVNQQSGVALRTVERQGETATFHFVDNSDVAKRFTAQILVDLIPKIYDTQRAILIIGEDGAQKAVKIDPAQQGAIEENEGIDGSVEKIYNPSVGRYDVVSTVGVSYETKRQEAAESMIAMSQANPAIWQTHGDLIVRSQDWPMADEFAKRFEKVMPPGLIEKEGEKVPPEVQQQLAQAQQEMQQHQQQIQELDSVIQKMAQELEAKEADKQAEQQKLAVDMYNAETNRMKAQPQQQTQQPGGNPEMTARMQQAELRKKEAEAAAAENNARESGRGLDKLENEAMTPELKNINEAISTLAEAIVNLHETMETIAQLSAKASLPRKSTLVLDESGMPVSSISEVIE
jgi:hypothetical protein